MKRPRRALILSLEFDYPEIHVVVGASLRMEDQHKQQRKRTGARAEADRQLPGPKMAQERFVPA